MALFSEVPTHGSALSDCCVTNLWVSIQLWKSRCVTYVMMRDQSHEA